MTHDGIVTAGDIWNCMEDSITDGEKHDDEQIINEPDPDDWREFKESVTDELVSKIPDIMAGLK